MWGVLIGLAVIGGFVKLALDEATGPTRLEKQQRTILARLGRLSDAAMTLDEAEDGAVLAKKFGCPELEKRFRQRIAKLRPFREGKIQR